MKSWLLLVAAVLLWPGGSSQNECEEPEDIDFGEIVSIEKAKYLENDRVQYRCNPGYVLEGPEWIQCKGQKWTSHPPKCLAPCSITRQQLVTKNLFVFGSQRKARLIQSNHNLQFQCNEGYVLVVPSVRKCVDGYMELPLCISDPCVIPRTELESQKIEVKDGTDVPENIFVQRGLSIELTCRTGYVMEANSSQSAFVIQCDGTPPVIPKCKEITCNSPRLSNGSFRPQRTLYHDGDLIRILCDSGFTFQPDNGEKVVECTRNGWSPSPKCVSEDACGPPARREREESIKELTAETYVHGHIISYKCRPGYVKAWPIKLECNYGVWRRLPPRKNCTGISCGSPGDSDYVRFELTQGEDFTFGARVVYTCNEGYKMLSKYNYRDCRANGWTNEVPRCENIGRKCGHPPLVENGDIVDSPKTAYFPSESVIYQCQNFYTMQGSPRVTCQNGHWSQTPTCRAACTASEEDMREHNIRLKWTNWDKIYSEDGNIVEFVCLRGYKQHPNTRSLRVSCVDGKFKYPDCIPI
ncbi:complement factor H-related protein 1-like isoform X9 [Ahaetulla prasina]|uniref:complement factor H-related protein 1-like isoform X9 n=1 Tax=Ahaetulla prasina TaxID=499056 RepID=UPI0026494E60|nr:complement factor H-related protein 1-like isoform X9 [Ahaetulla prasina]